MTPSRAWWCAAAWLLTGVASGQDVVLGDLSIRPVLAAPGVIQSLAAADMDGDGRLDALVANADDVAILLSRPGGSLTGDWQDVGLGAVVREVAALDWDLDGRLDLAVVRDNRRLNVWTGDGAGGVVTQLKPEAVKAQACALDIGDMNGDGLVDILLGQGGPHELEVILADGTEDGAASLITPLINATIDVTLADLDGDGDLDVVSTEFSRARWWLSDGAGGLSLGGDLPLNGVPETVRAAELDGDPASEWLALVRPSVGDHRVKVLDTLADGTPVLLQDLETTGDYETLAVVDLQGDGLDEIYLGADYPGQHGDTDQVVLRRPLGDGTLGEPQELPTGTRITALSAADLTGDGVLDLLVGHAPLGEDPDNPERLLVLHRGDGLGGLLGPVVSPEDAISTLGRPQLVDLDRDGLLDVVATHTYQGVEVYAGRGHLHLSAPQNLSGIGYGQQLVVADLDGDGHGDLVVTDNQEVDPRLTIHLNDGSLDPPATWTFPSPWGSHEPLVQDMGADGDLDIVEVWSLVPDPKALVRVIAQQDGRFAPVEKTALVVVRYLAGGDLDGDGCPDVLTLAGDGGLKTLLGARGSDALGHGPTGQVPVASIQRGQLADLDGDGDLDLAVPGKAGFGNETCEIHLLANDGDGAFQAVDVLTTPYVFALELADLDGDGAPELVTPQGFDMIVRSGSLGSPWSTERYGNRVDVLADLDGDQRPEALFGGFGFSATPHGHSTWFDVDGGVAGGPRLVALGDLAPGGPLSLRITGAAPHGVVWIVAGAAPLGAPKGGGLLVPRPDVVMPLAVDGDGTLTLPLVLPSVALAGVPLWLQAWTADGGLLPGDGLFGVTP